MCRPTGILKVPILGLLAHTLKLPNEGKNQRQVFDINDTWKPNIEVEHDESL